MVPEVLGIKKLRRDLIKKAHDQVLEVAVGTGYNLPYYSRECSITAIDFSAEMLAKAQHQAEKFGIQADFILMEAEELGFDSDRFDTVVSTLAMCAYTDPLKALREMARVCKPGGDVLLLEHGESNVKWLASLQERTDLKWHRSFGCHWNRDILDIAQEAGLEIKSYERHLFGILYVIETEPIK